MQIVISNSKQQKIFSNKDFITIGGSSQFDFFFDLGFDYMLTVEFDQNSGKLTVLNNFNSDKILFKGQPLSSKLEVDKICKLQVKNSEEFIAVKLIKEEINVSTPITTETIKQNPIQDKIENLKTDIEKKRVTITKQIAFTITDLKKRILTNTNVAIIVNVALFLSSIISAFGVTNYLMGLPITESETFLNMPTNIKILFLFAIVIFGVSLILKQGVYLIFEESDSNKGSKFVANFMLFMAGIFMVAFYIINVIYYSNPNGRIFFATLISLFFVMLTSTLAISAGYFKFNGHKLSKELDKYEFREDLEIVLNAYQVWIERFINSIGKGKLDYIKEKAFTLNLKGIGETILGILTAPFLAYGVSNTLAMCFPEAAGWIRISGLRFSPIFLVLATMLIIFAFFSFVNAFVNGKKVAGSDVIKLDGYRNYLSHGVDIYGLENSRKIKSEQNRSFIIGISIIFIEFTMNVSYFMTEIGGDFNGLFLSLVAALVPTALLLAETYMLSATKYEIFVTDTLFAKLDR